MCAVANKLAAITCMLAFVIEVENNGLLVCVPVCVGQTMAKVGNGAAMMFYEEVKEEACLAQMVTRLYCVLILPCASRMSLSAS